MGTVFSRTTKWMGCCLSIPLWCICAVAVHGAEDYRALVSRLDTDDNRQLAVDEVPTDHQRLFTRLLRIADADKSGTLSVDEFEHGLTPTRPLKPLEQKVSSELPGAAETRVLLLTMDVDRTAVIEASEVPIELLDAFDQLVEEADANGDDRLNQFELARAGRRLTRWAQRTVRELDIDVEAELSKLEESQGEQAKRFDEPPGRGAMLADGDRAARLFAQLDSNRDGFLEPDELPQPLRERLQLLFRRADRNADGRLSNEEYRRGVERAGRLRQQSR